MTTQNQTKTESVFSGWLIIGLVLYLCGFYLAPSSKAQYLTLYIGLILPALYFTLFHFRRYFLDDQRSLLWVALITIALYLPSLWVDGDVPDTLRKNLKCVIFVISLAVAVRHLQLDYPTLAQRFPAIILAVSIAALLLFYVVLAREGLQKDGNLGMGNLGDNPNETGLALSVGFLVLATSLMVKARLVGYLLAIPFLVAIVLANSRAAMLGLAVSLPFAVLFQKGYSRLAIAYLACGLLGALAIVGLMIAGYLDAERLLSKRPSLWGEFLSHFPNFNPWWGSGLSGSVTVFSEVQGKKLEPHSLFFALILRGGLLAAGLFIALVALTVIQHGRRASQQSIWLYILLFGLATQFFEGVYPVRPPNSFWLYTWLPILMILLKANKKHADL